MLWPKITCLAIRDGNYKKQQATLQLWKALNFDVELECMVKKICDIILFFPKMIFQKVDFNLKTNHQTLPKFTTTTYNMKRCLSFFHFQILNIVKFG
jgi:hypothetical protein